MMSQKHITFGDCCRLVIENSEGKANSSKMKWNTLLIDSDAIIFFIRLVGRKYSRWGKNVLKKYERNVSWNLEDEALAEAIGNVVLLGIFYSHLNDATHFHILAKFCTVYRLDHYMRVSHSGNDSTVLFCLFLLHQLPLPPSCRMLCISFRLFSDSYFDGVVRSEIDSILIAGIIHRELLRRRFQETPAELEKRWTDVGVDRIPLKFASLRF